jgi:hypothetical protein
LFFDIEERYGDAIEWTTLGRLAATLSGSYSTLPLEKCHAESITYRAA